MIILQGLGFDLGNESSKKQSLTEILHYYEFLETEMPKLKEKWDLKKNKKNRTI